MEGEALGLSNSRPKRGRPAKWASKAEQQAVYAKRLKDKRKQQQQQRQNEFQPIESYSVTTPAVGSMFGTLDLQTHETLDHAHLSTALNETAAPNNLFTQLSETLVSDTDIGLMHDAEGNEISEEAGLAGNMNALSVLQDASQFEESGGAIGHSNINNGSISQEGQNMEHDVHSDTHSHEQGTSVELGYLAQQLATQLLSTHGCTGDHKTPGSISSTEQQVCSIQDLVNIPIPDILGEQTISSFPYDWDHQFPLAKRVTAYTGKFECPQTVEASTLPDGVAPTPVFEPEAAAIHIQRDEVSPPSQLSVWFDIDSAGGFASSLAIARCGLKWTAPRPPVSNLTSSLHLNPLPVEFMDESGKWHHRLQPIHHIPHLPLGRLCGLEDVEIYVLFPGLYHPAIKNWVINKKHYEEWMDLIFLPALHAVLPAAAIQHLPATAADMQAKAMATGIEKGTQQKDTPRIQLMQYMIQPQYLSNIWNAVLRQIQHLSLVKFKAPCLLITAKNLKTSTSLEEWGSMYTGFMDKWQTAVDTQYLINDYYDIGKETLPGNCSYHIHEATDTEMLTLTWRHCCLDSFSDWLNQVEVDLLAHYAEPGLFNTNGANVDQHSNSLRVSENTGVSPSGVTSFHTEAAERPNDTQMSASDTSESIHQDSRSYSQWRQQVSLHSSWEKVFYPLACLADAGSLTLEPHRHSPLRQHGLLYCQLYNSIKEIFAAGKVYPFTNPSLDTLAVDPGLVRAWQHLGGAISHKPLALLRAYLHTKQRCHVSLESHQQHHWGTREEYRVSGPLLHAIHRVMPVRLPQSLYQPSYLQQSHDSITASLQPFFCHSTSTILAWLRWNINRLCVGFEMTYSLQPRTVVHWEHTRIMMLFLRALLHFHGGNGAHPQRCKALWVDRQELQVNSPDEPPQLQEGMGVQMMLEKCRFGWFQNKIDWLSMTFLPEHRKTICLRAPSLLGSYHAQYRHLITRQREFLLVHDVFTQLAAHQADTHKSALLLHLLMEFCLHAFRCDVFAVLEKSKIGACFNRAQLVTALQGQVPLTAPGMQQVLDQVPLDQYFHFVQPGRLQVNHIEVLFIWLWGWNGDGNNGSWQRHGWENKAYRVVYHQCFDMISRLYGLRQARAWRVNLCNTFIRTHWLLPYPTTQTFWSKTKHAASQPYKLKMWASFHPGLVAYYQDPISDGDQHKHFQPAEAAWLPTYGWENKGKPMLFNMGLPPLPKDIPEYLAAARPVNIQGQNERILSLPFPPMQTLDGPIMQYIYAHIPEKIMLRSFHDMHPETANDPTQNREWLVKHLFHFTEAMAQAYEQQVQDLSMPLDAPRTRMWKRQCFQTITRDLGALSQSLQPADLDEDSESDSISKRQAQAQKQYHRVRVKQKFVHKGIKSLMSALWDMKSLEKTIKRHPGDSKDIENLKHEFRIARHSCQKNEKQLQRVAEQFTGRLLNERLHSLMGK